MFPCKIKPILRSTVAALWTWQNPSRVPLDSVHLHSPHVSKLKSSATSSLEEPPPKKKRSWRQTKNTSKRALLLRRESTKRGCPVHIFFNRWNDSSFQVTLVCRSSATDTVAASPEIPPTPATVLAKKQQPSSKHANRGPRGIQDSPLFECGAEASFTCAAPLANHPFPLSRT